MSTLTNPSYSNVVEPMLREHDGDPSALLHAYPNFDPEALSLWDDQPYLHDACYEDHFHAVRGLVQCGASLLRKNADGWPALHCACGIHSKDMVAWLLSQHADTRATVNCAGKYGWTSLHAAARWGNSAVIRLLLRYGADPTLKNKKEMTPAQVARDRGRDGTAEVLEVAERVHFVLAIGEWRPHKQARFPPAYRAATRTLVVLAKARTPAPEDTSELHSHYPRACLDLLPEELLQYLFAYITTAPVPDVWTLNL